MKQSLRLAGLAAAIPLAGGALLPATAAAAPLTLKFTATQYKFKQKGKTVTFKEHFASAGRTIGGDAVTCTKGAHAYSCLGTFTFTSGALKIKATVGSGKVNHGTVLSGTGRYAGQTGTFTLTDVANNKTNIVINLH
jgi:hypothetical protein